MSSIIMAANAVSNGMAVFKPLYWLFGKCMAFLLDILNNQYFIALIIFTVVTVSYTHLTLPTTPYV